MSQEKLTIIKSPIANAITAVDDTHVVAVSSDIYDETLGRYQSELNNIFINMTGEGTTADLTDIKNDLAFLLWDKTKLTISPSSLTVFVGANVDKDYTATFTSPSPSVKLDTLEISCNDQYASKSENEIEDLDNTNGIKNEISIRISTTIHTTTTIQANAICGDNSKPASSTITAVNKVYRGFLQGDKSTLFNDNYALLTPVTNIGAGEYEETLVGSGYYFYFAVPEGITGIDENSFKMSGYGAGIVKDEFKDENITNNVKYTIYRSGSSYSDNTVKFTWNK